MRYLTLLRHGKSDWDESHRSDFDRPLKARGRRDALQMGEYLASLGLVPDLIVSSPAERARLTAELFADGVGYDEAIDWEEGIYAASPGKLLAILRHQPDDADHLLFVGHNPGFEDLTGYLAGLGQRGATYGVSIPTATAVHLAL
ncbi:MAG TPA: histidine phosphatase family protein, partial [Anaerolineae bacterium]|nr:histidine phosphatase family protein [Anaerolineae bacterium]